MKVVKLCIGDWENASHDKRELFVCRELGTEVYVIAKGDETHLDGYVDGFYVKRLSTRPLGSKCPIIINRIVSIFLWAYAVSKQTDIDVLSCHDLIALLIGYLSNFGKNKKAKLVYDSHEFELGRNIERSALRRFLVFCLEKFLIKKCVFSIMVNDSIADEVQRVYNLKQRPIVARNAQEFQNIDKKVCDEIRKKINRKFNLENKTLLVTHGNLGEDRGVEELIEVIANREDLCLLLLGNGTREYIKKIRRCSEKKDCGERLIIHRAVEQNCIWKYVGAADIAFSLIQPKSKSYYFSLPNKFYESMQAEVPIIASDLPEMKKIVEKHEIGCCCKSDDIEAIQKCIDHIMKDERYSYYKQNVIEAKKQLCWENEKKAVLEAYRRILK